MECQIRVPANSWMVIDLEGVELMIGFLSTCFMYILYFYFWLGHIHAAILTSITLF